VLSSIIEPLLLTTCTVAGPPSQSLGVDPVDPAVMRKPPRKKGEPVISKRLLARVLFSASIIVLGTLFVYAHELSDGSMSNRDQTMARFPCLALRVSSQLTPHMHADIYMFRLP
jgi:P-type Ca2+ transporter type 2C